MENRENCIEFISSEKTATITFTQQKYINRIKTLHNERPEDFKFFIENKDGSVCAKIPIRWIKISPTKRNSRIYTEEEKRKIAERLENARRNKSIHA